MRSNNRSSAT